MTMSLIFTFELSFPKLPKELYPETNLLKIIFLSVLCARYRGRVLSAKNIPISHFQSSLESAREEAQNK